MQGKAVVQSFGRLVDRWLGRGSYRWIRPLFARHKKYSYREYADILGALLTGETRWLDAGCGHQVLDPRWVEEEMALVRRAGVPVGCDVCADALRVHRSIPNRVHCGLEQLPFREASFTLVTLNMVAEHLPHPERAFREISRVLAPGGLLVVRTPNAASYPVGLIRLGWALFPRRWGLLAARFLEHRESDDVFPTYYRANTGDAVANLGRRWGMEVRELRYVQGRPFFYFFAPFSLIELLFAWCICAMGKSKLASSAMLIVLERLPGPVGRAVSNGLLPKECNAAAVASERG